MHTLIHKTKTFQSSASQPKMGYLLMIGESLACIFCSYFVDI